jgi:3-oxoadipate enol-lactonase
VSAERFTGRVEIDGVRFGCRVDGPGDEGAPAVVMLHSLGTTSEMWNPQAAALSPHFRVVRMDCRGHGWSDLPGEPITIERLGRDVIRLLDHFELSRASLCGLSLGGITALWIAAHHPERVDRAVFANTGARIGSTESWDARIEAVQHGGLGAIRDVVLSRFLGGDFRAAHPDVAAAIGRMIDDTSAVGYIAVCRGLRDADVSKDLARIRAPSLIIAGERDESTPPALSEALHAGIPGSELLLLPGAAHLSNVERPDDFTTAVARFLSGS